MSVKNWKQKWRSNIFQRSLPVLKLLEMSASAIESTEKYSFLALVGLWGTAKSCNMGLLEWEYTDVAIFWPLDVHIFALEFHFPGH